MGDQVRVSLRKFDPSNVVTGLNGTLTGTHTVVNNALATKQPFAQAARVHDPAVGVPEVAHLVVAAEARDVDDVAGRVREPGGA